MSFEESSLWKSTLGRNEDGDKGQFIERLRAAFLQFREAVSPVAGDIALSAPGYTDHSIEHCDALWDTASLLLPDEYPINPVEAFVLGGSFLVHDLGMGLSAYPGGLSEILDRTEWLDLLSVRFPETAAELNAQAKSDVKSNPNWDGLTSNDVKEVLTTYLRNNHARQAREIVSAAWTLGDGTTEYLLSDAKMRAWYGDLIGEIAKSHWADVDVLPERFPSEYGALPGFPTEWTVDATKLACLLRMADAIQIDGRRADPLHTPHRNPQGESLAHWQFQEKLLTAQVVDGRLVFSSATSFGSDRIEAWWTAFDMIRMIDAELRKVDNLSADLGKPRLRAHAVAGADSSIRFAAFVHPEGWEPIDTSPHIGSPVEVIGKLGGTALYGTNSDSGAITVREILANALDATRALRLAYDEMRPSPVEVRFITSEETDSVSIRDYGIGMTKEDVVTNLCDFGVSGWKGSSVRENFPGILSQGYAPTGRFGIGFFSAFMASKHVKVRTRHFEAAKSDTYILEFVGGLSSRPIFRRASRVEQLIEPGTEVRVDLKHRFVDEGGMFAQLAPAMLETQDYLPRFIGDLAFMADESVVVAPVGSDELVEAVVANSWRTLASDEVCDAIHSPAFYKNPGYLRMRERFAHLIAPIKGRDGEVIGRIGVDAVVDSNDDDYWTAWGQGHCGGLRTAMLADVIGVLDAKPANAARNDLVFDIALEHLQEWYRDQVVRVLELELDQATLANVQKFGIGIDAISDELPLTFSQSGHLSPSEFTEAIANADEFAYVSLHPTSYVLEGNDYHGAVLDNDFALVPEHVFLGARRPFDPQRGLGLRPNDLAAECREHVRTSPIFDAFTWWESNYMNLGAELVRMAARAWEIPLADLVSRIEWLDIDEEEDRRIGFLTLSNRQRKFPGIRVVRRAKDTAIERVGI
jgi:hypothetical protein